MSFKENLLKKIRIDALTRKVIASIGPPDSGLKIDKEAMRSLLEMSPYRHLKKRDLDLYMIDAESETKKILVLDNELPIYKTTVEDVVLRKSPYIKEMVSLRNVIKILKDSDVKLSIKQDSAKAVQKESIERLDLSYNQSDLDQIAKEAAAALENKYVEGVSESLDLFAELLDYRPPPMVFGIRHHKLIGALIEKEGGELLYGPMVIYSLMGNSLKLIEKPISSLDEEKLNHIRQVAMGNDKADLEGADVIKYLQQAVMKKKDSNLKPQQP
jgi:hypothetical protein